MSHRGVCRGNGLLKHADGLVTARAGAVHAGDVTEELDVAFMRTLVTHHPRGGEVVRPAMMAVTMAVTVAVMAVTVGMVMAVLVRVVLVAAVQ